MTLANTPDRPRAPSGRRPLLLAMGLAIAAVAIAALVILGGRSRPASERRDGRAAVQASTPAEDAADAVDARPALDAVGPGAFGGPGSAADGSTGPLQGVEQQVVAERRASQPRRSARRRAEARPAAPAEQPSYRVIGPTAADEAAPPQT